MEWKEEGNTDDNISNGESVSNEVWSALEVGVEWSDGFLKILDSIVEDISLANSPSEDCSVDGVEVWDDVWVWEVNELIDLSVLEVVVSWETVSWVSGEVSGDGSWLDEVTVFGLEEWELAGEWLGLEFLWLGFFFWDDDFGEFNLGELGSNNSEISEWVTDLVVVVDFLLKYEVRKQRYRLVIFEDLPFVGLGYYLI